MKPETQNKQEKAMRQEQKIIKKTDEPQSWVLFYMKNSMFWTFKTKTKNVIGCRFRAYENGPLIMIRVYWQLLTQQTSRIEIEMAALGSPAQENLPPCVEEKKKKKPRS